MATAVMGVHAPSFQPQTVSAPSDYADLMDELALCRSPEGARMWALGTVARRCALPQPYRNAVNAALDASSKPVDDGTLYLIADDGADMGIGTATEVRELIASGILPHTVVLTAYHGEAANA